MSIADLYEQTVWIGCGTSFEDGRLTACSLSLLLLLLTAIVRSIYKMTGQMVKLPADEDTPEKVRSVAVGLFKALSSDFLFCLQNLSATF